MEGFLLIIMKILVIIILEGIMRERGQLLKLDTSGAMA